MIIAYMGTSKYMSSRLSIKWSYNENIWETIIINKCKTEFLVHWWLSKDKSLAVLLWLCFLQLQQKDHVSWKPQHLEPDLTY